eukprot:gene9876-19104_t
MATQTQSRQRCNAAGLLLPLLLAATLSPSPTTALPSESNAVDALPLSLPVPARHGRSSDAAPAEHAGTFVDLGGGGCRGPNMERQNSLSYHTVAKLSTCMALCLENEACTGIEWFNPINGEAHPGRGQVWVCSSSLSSSNPAPETEQAADSLPLVDADALDKALPHVVANDPPDAPSGGTADQVDADLFTDLGLGGCRGSDATHNHNSFQYHVVSTMHDCEAKCVGVWDCTAIEWFGEPGALEEGAASGTPNCQLQNWDVATSANQSDHVFYRGEVRCLRLDRVPSTTTTSETSTTVSTTSGTSTTATVTSTTRTRTTTTFTSTTTSLTATTTTASSTTTTITGTTTTVTLTTTTATSTSTTGTRTTGTSTTITTVTGTSTTGTTATGTSTTATVTSTTTSGTTTTVTSTTTSHTGTTSTSTTVTTTSVSTTTTTATTTSTTTTLTSTPTTTATSSPTTTFTCTMTTTQTTTVTTSQTSTLTSSPTTTASTTATTTPSSTGTTTQTTTPTTNRCYPIADILFLIDGSTSIEEPELGGVHGNFRKMTEFAAGIVDDLAAEIGPHGMRVAIMTFATIPTQVLGYSARRDAAGVAEQVLLDLEHEHRFVYSETNFDVALEAVRTEWAGNGTLTTEIDWARRPEYPAHLVVLTDGKGSPTDADKPVSALARLQAELNHPAWRDTSVTRWAFDVSSDPDFGTLNLLASEPLQKHRGDLSAGSRANFVASLMADNELCETTTATTTATSTPTTTPCHSVRADVVFMLDASDSAEAACDGGASGWDRARNLAATIVRAVGNTGDVGADAVRFALVAYSGTGAVLFDFKELGYDDAEAIAAMIEAFSDPNIVNFGADQQPTIATAGFSTAEAELFLEERGYRGARGLNGSTPLFVVTISDGKSLNRRNLEAQLTDPRSVFSRGPGSVGGTHLLAYELGPPSAVPAIEAERQQTLALVGRDGIRKAECAGSSEADAATVAAFTAQLDFLPCLTSTATSTTATGTTTTGTGTTTTTITTTSATTTTTSTVTSFTETSTTTVSSTTSTVTSTTTSHTGTTSTYTGTSSTNTATSTTATGTTTSATATTISQTTTSQTSTTTSATATTTSATVTSTSVTATTTTQTTTTQTSTTSTGTSTTTETSTTITATSTTITATSTTDTLSTTTSITETSTSTATTTTTTPIPLPVLFLEPNRHLYALLLLLLVLPIAALAWGCGYCAPAGGALFAKEPMVVVTQPLPFAAPTAPAATGGGGTGYVFEEIFEVDDFGNLIGGLGGGGGGRGGGYVSSGNNNTTNEHFQLDMEEYDGSFDSADDLSDSDDGSYMGGGSGYEISDRDMPWDDFLA